MVLVILNVPYAVILQVSESTFYAKRWESNELGWMVISLDFNFIYRFGFYDDLCSGHAISLPSKFSPLVDVDSCTGHANVCDRCTFLTFYNVSWLRSIYAMLLVVGVLAGMLGSYMGYRHTTIKLRES